MYNNLKTLFFALITLHQSSSRVYKYFLKIRLRLNLKTLFPSASPMLALLLQTLQDSLMYFLCFFFLHYARHYAFSYHFVVFALVIARYNISSKNDRIERLKIEREHLARIRYSFLTCFPFKPTFVETLQCLLSISYSLLLPTKIHS